MAKIGFPRLVSNSDKPRAQAPVLPLSKVRLRNKETGEETLHANVDGIEIMNGHNSVYELIPGMNYPQTFLRRVGLGTDEPPEAA
jgi:hypothetical protein